MKAGTFSRSKGGLVAGKVHAIGLGFFDAVFEERTSKEGATYYKFIADPEGTHTEVGTAWPHEKDQKTYYTINLESVTSPYPLDLALFPDGHTAGQYNLVFDPERQGPKANVKVETEQSPPTEQKAQPQKQSFFKRRMNITP